MSDSLNSKAITEHLCPKAREFFCPIETHLSLSSTQDYCVRQASSAGSSNLVVFAEHQSLGRGRTGRTWVSPKDAQLCFSLIWNPAIKKNKLSGLSLLVGIAIAKALREYSIKGVMLKWPNDLIVDGKKLGGILVEILEHAVVIGAGINIQLPQTIQTTINQPVTDLATTNPSTIIHRNTLAAVILNSLHSHLTKFEQTGFSAFVADWQTVDYLFNKTLEWRSNSIIKTGLAAGVSDKGELLLKHPKGTHIISSGSVRVRA